MSSEGVSGGRASESDGAVDARVYRVLGEQFLTRPDRERIDAVAQWATAWRDNADGLPLEIESALERIEDGASADEETIRQSYTRLFRGVSEQALDPPYESVYVDGQFYSSTTTEIRQGYRWAGVDIDDTAGKEPPDHLGIELQFVGELVAMADGDTRSDEPDIEDALWWMLDEHLTEWLPAYLARVHQGDPHDYYVGLLDLTLAVINRHRDRLAENR
jgi:TorA maturation chaperone TorD